MNRVTFLTRFMLLAGCTEFRPERPPPPPQPLGTELHVNLLNSCFFRHNRSADATLPGC